MAQLYLINKDEYIKKLESLCSPGVSMPDDLIDVDEAEDSFEKMTKSVDGITKSCEHAVDLINSLASMITIISDKTISIDKAELREYLMEVREPILTAYHELTGTWYPKRKDDAK